MAQLVQQIAPIVQQIFGMVAELHMELVTIPREQERARQPISSRSKRIKKVGIRKTGIKAKRPLKKRRTKAKATAVTTNKFLPSGAIRNLVQVVQMQMVQMQVVWEVWWLEWLK